MFRKRKRDKAVMDSQLDINGEEKEISSSRGGVNILKDGEELRVKGKEEGYS